MAESDHPQVTSPEGPQSGDSQTQAAAPAHNGERPTLVEYTTQGRTHVRTRRGHQVIPSDTSLPQFGATGIKMNAEQADALVKEFPDYVVVDDKEGE